MMSYTGHIAFISTFTEYAETAAVEPRPYINFYGNVSFVAAFVAVIIALLIDFHSRNITDQDKGQKLNLYRLRFELLFYLTLSTHTNR